MGRRSDGGGNFSVTSCSLTTMMSRRCRTRLSRYGMSSDLGQSSVKLMRAAAACACTRGLLWSFIVSSRVEITWGGGLIGCHGISMASCCVLRDQCVCDHNDNVFVAQLVLKSNLGTFSWNFFWKVGAKSVAICPMALQAA